jgi:hypothetical protein
MPLKQQAAASMGLLPPPGLLRGLLPQPGQAATGGSLSPMDLTATLVGGNIF